MKILCSLVGRIRLLLVGCLILINILSTAQFLPEIQPVQKDQEAFLKRQLAIVKSDSSTAIEMIQLGSIYLYRPYPKTANLRTAMRLLRQARKISLKGQYVKAYNDAQFLVATVFLRMDQPDSAISLLRYVNDTTQFNILIALAEIYRSRESDDKKSDRSKAVGFALQAEHIGEKLGISLKKVLAMREIACIHSDTREQNAEKELLDVIRKFGSLRYPYLHYTYLALADLSFNQGDFDKALFYSQQTLNSMTQTGDSAEAADFLFMHAMVLRAIGQHEKSIEYGKLAIDLYKEQYGFETIAWSIQPITDEMVKLKRKEEANKLIMKLFKEFPPDNSFDSSEWFKALGNFYRLTRDYARAEIYLQQQLSILDRLKIVDESNLHAIGQLYVEAGNFVKAKLYLEKALQIADSAVSMRTMGHLHYCLFLADSATGDYISAIRHLTQNKRYDDSVLTQSKENAIQKYLLQFETEKNETDLKLKDQQIKILTKDREVKESNLRQTSLIKNITLYGSLVLLAGFFISYYQYRQKRNANKTISKINADLQQLLTEKVWLLREVHHRVKNNLHTIICLLESQARHLESDALQAIEKSQHRIYAMSLIHQKLYQNGDLRTIDISVYLREFIQYLKESFDANAIYIGVQVDPIHLNLSQAISVAIIINEAVTNSIKYAFPDHPQPEIVISMTESEDAVRLIIADNGKGFVPGDMDERKSMGIQLIKGISKEIKGNAIIDGSNGTTVTIQFKKELVSTPQQIIQKMISISEG